MVVMQTNYHSHCQVCGEKTKDYYWWLSCDEHQTISVCRPCNYAWTSVGLYNCRISINGHMFYFDEHVDDEEKMRAYIKTIEPVDDWIREGF